MSEFCHGIKPFLQPHPTKNEGGDCFACALTAILQHLYPKNPPSFEQCWNYFIGKYYYKSDKDCLDHGWPGMRKALCKACDDGYKLDFEADIVKPEYDIETFSYAWWSFKPVSKYAQRLEGWLRCGYIALTEIDFYGKGAITPEGYNNSINHIVVLDGIKTYWKNRYDDNGKWSSASQEHEVHVVCSVKGEYWINIREFLTKYGGAGWWLVKRRNNEYVD